MRRFIRILSAGTLFLFFAGVMFIFLCAMFLSPPPEEPHPYFHEGFIRDGEHFRSPRFSGDGSLLYLERVESYRHPGSREVRERRKEIAVPTGFPARRDVPQQDLGRLEWFFQRLLHLGGLLLPGGEVAVSPGRAGMVFTNKRGVFLKDRSGKWISVAGEGPPRELIRLNETPRGRLAHPDLLVWMDAVIESMMEQGIQGRLFSDALLRWYQDRRALREPLLELLFAAGDPGEIVRTILEVSEEGLFRGAILNRFVRLESESHPAGPARVLLWMTRPSWAGYSIGPYLKDYLVRALETGIFDLLSEQDQRSPFKRMLRVLDPSHFNRLARVLEEREGCSGVAAWLLLRRFEGVPRGGYPRKSRIPVAKRWWAENRDRLRESRNK